ALVASSPCRPAEHDSGRRELYDSIARPVKPPIDSPRHAFVIRDSSPRSRLGLYAETLLEAGWLAVLIVAPLFFNPLGSRPFIVGTVALVQILAIVMALAWVVRCVESRHWRSTNNPLAVPALAFLAASVISTLASVSPSTSLYGSYERSQGLYTVASYVVVF